MFPDRETPHTPFPPNAAFVQFALFANFPQTARPFSPSRPASAAVMCSSGVFPEPIMPHRDTFALVPTEFRAGARLDQRADVPMCRWCSVLLPSMSVSSITPMTTLASLLIRPTRKPALRRFRMYPKTQ